MHLDQDGHAPTHTILNTTVRGPFFLVCPVPQATSWQDVTIFSLIRMLLLRLIIVAVVVLSLSVAVTSASAWDLDDTLLFIETSLAIQSVGRNQQTTENMDDAEELATELKLSDLPDADQLYWVASSDYRDAYARYSALPKVSKEIEEGNHGPAIAAAKEDLKSKLHSLWPVTQAYRAIREKQAARGVPVQPQA